ncbi:hypothetical protein BpHYR1_006991 [Brachionus plicatilis]|uniref:Uncharacterized protein n=1 Tax=Brachionus plicatilis TaxID=10195 RepID=A0A3M7S2I3_BRAPC|nr:hypothetical protein BpHYR1_006991 [Brachionus plicatilis]
MFIISNDQQTKSVLPFWKFVGKDIYTFLFSAFYKHQLSVNKKRTCILFILLNSIENNVILEKNENEVQKNRIRLIKSPAKNFVSSHYVQRATIGDLSCRTPPQASLAFFAIIMAYFTNSFDLLLMKTNPICWLCTKCTEEKIKQKNHTMSHYLQVDKMNDLSKKIRLFPKPSQGHVMFQPSPTQVTLKEETPKKTRQSTKTRNKASAAIHIPHAAPKRSRGRPRKNVNKENTTKSQISILSVTKNEY